VAPDPDVVIPPVPTIERALAAGVAVPESVGKVRELVPETSIVIVFPDAEVDAPVPPRTSRVLLKGTALPESVLNVVGICGLFATSSIIPA
tara:strand:+ start:347 stop:619 length:273 start_codon:yes stop_codon:yes gene_type:complete